MKAITKLDAEQKSILLELIKGKIRDLEDDADECLSIKAYYEERRKLIHSEIKTLRAAQSNVEHLEVYGGVPDWMMRRVVSDEELGISED